MRDRVPAGRKRLRRAWLPALLVLAVVPPLMAQEPPPEPSLAEPGSPAQAPPPEPSAEPVSPRPVDQPIAGGRPIPGAPPPQNFVVAAQRQRRSPWGVQVRASEGWVRNPRAEPGDTTGSFAAQGAFTADYQHASEHGAIHFSGNAVATRYHQNEGPSNVQGGGSVSIGRSLSRRATFTLGDALDTRYAYESPLLTGSGVLLGAVRTTTNVANAGLDYRLGAMTGLQLDARHEYVAFDDPTLLGGSQLAASATLTHRRSTVTGLAASYLFGANSASAQRWTTHTGFASWRRMLGPRWTSGLALGVTHSTRTGSNYPYAVAELGTVYVGTLMSARNSNTVSQSYGGGYEQEMMTFGLTARRAVGRRLTVSLSGSYADSQEVATGSAGSPIPPANAATRHRATIHGSGGFSVKLTRTLALDMNAFAMRLHPRPDEASIAATDTVTAGVGLALVYETPNR